LVAVTEIPDQLAAVTQAIDYGELPGLRLIPV